MLYVISDIHGEYQLFLDLLDKIKFSATDEMIICGDIIDKGEHSVKLLKYIMSQPNIRCILGNHEYAFLKYYWALMKDCEDNYDLVLAKLKEYFSNDGYLLDWETVDWIESLPFWIEEDSFICVHAGIPLTLDNHLMPLEKVRVEYLVNDRWFKEPNVVHLSKKCVFFGHTPTSYVTGKNEIAAYLKPNKTSAQSILDFCKIHLDTGSWLCGILGCFCVETRMAYYVSNLSVKKNL